MANKSIIEALKTDDSLRITNGAKWMYFDNITREWVICNKPYNSC